MKKGSQKKANKILGKTQDEPEWPEQEHWQILAEELHRGPSLEYFKENWVGVGGVVVASFATVSVLYVLFGIDRN